MILPARASEGNARTKEGGLASRDREKNGCSVKELSVAGVDG